MSKLRYALAAVAVAGATVPMAAPAQAMVCHPAFQDVCSTLGLVCSKLDNPKLGVLRCPGLG